MSELFSEDELLNLEENNLFSNKPVTVLGKTFDNDTDRRKYFREELRKKLPELKKLEGYPIGEDDDIINLSDPPYYTACPNPWLNDFVAEWEKEKESPELKKLRKDDFEIKDPYASDVSEGKSNPVYSAQTYHTKVPHPAVMRYLLHYTQPGDIVFDGFAGTGMTGVATQACENPDIDLKNKIEDEFLKLDYKKPTWGRRHALCGDLSPYASLMSYNYNTPIDPKLLELEAKRIFKEVKEECKWMYYTKQDDKDAYINYVVWSDVCICSECGGEYVYWDTAIDYENKCLRDIFNCPHCNATQNKKHLQKAIITSYDYKLKESVTEVKSIPVIVVCTTIDGKRFERKPTDLDFEILKKIEQTKCDYFFPTDKLPHGFNLDQPQKSHHILYFHQFYTKRNLIALATLYDKILKSSIPNKMRFIFTGMINRSTRMNRVHVSNYFYGGGGWNVGHLKGTLYIPNAPIETSILEQVEDKLKLYLRAIPLLPKIYDNAVFIASAENSGLKDNTIDYIFVDPPFGANIMYSELNTLPEAWFRIFTNNKSEAIENPGQNKDRLFYLNEMKKCFSEFYRILKPGKWMTVEFSNTSSAIWNAIQNAITSSGFVIANIAALDKKQGGMRGIITATAVRQDLAISCYKPSETFTRNFLLQDGHTNTWCFVQEHLEHLPLPMVIEDKTTSIVERSPKVLYDRMITYFLMHGLPVPLDAADFQEGLRNRYIQEDGMIFTSAQLNQYHELKKKHNITDQPSLFVDIIESENDAIQWIK